MSASLVATVTLIATVVIAALCALIGVLLFVRKGSWTGLVRSLGIAAVVVGLYFLGVMELLVLGTEYVIEWIATTVWTTQMTNASIIIGIGLVAALLAGFLPKRRHAAKEQATPGAQHSGKGQVTARSAAASPKARAGQPTDAGLDPEDAEIEAMLKARGIE